MSEQGWREFLAADGVDDWVVLHGGATAVFKVGSIGEAARLAAASEVASAHGAVGDRVSVQEVQLAIASKPDAVDVGFWRAVLGYAPLGDDAGVDPLGHGSTVWMQELDEAKPLRHAMHVDVSVGRDHVEGRLAAALAAGGRVVWESEEHWTLADRAGNRVCITAWPDGATKAPPDPA